MNKPPKLFKFILPVLLALPIYMDAQSTTKLTLSDAIAKGLQESKTLKYDHSKIDAAIAKYNESKDAHLPDVKVAAGYTYLSNLDPGYQKIQFGPETLVLYENDNYMSHASLSEPIFTGFKQKYAEESARLMMEASRLDVEKDKDEVTMNIINSYFNLYKAEQTKKQIEDNIVQIKERLKEQQDAFDKGNVIQNDVLRVQLQLSNRQLDLIQAGNNISIINYNLGILLGLPNNTLVEIDSTSMFETKSLKSSDDYQRDALSQRQELKANNMRIHAAETGINIAKGSYYPTLAVGADYYYSMPNQRYFPVLDQFKPSWDAGINLSWDITGLFTNKHQIAEANASLVQGQINNSMVTDQIKMDVNSSFTSYVESLKRIEVAKIAVTQAEENYRTLTSRYNNRVALLSDLLDANNLLLQSKINETLAYADSELAYKKLLKATGNLK